MGNNKICIQRNIEGVPTAPVFDDEEFMGVDLEFGEMMRGIKELSVRIYNQNYLLMGVRTLTFERVKPIRRCHFDVQTSEKWAENIYSIYVYRNGRPAWFARLAMSGCYGRKEQGVLEDITYMPRESFFAETVCRNVWWSDLVEMNLGRDIMARVVDRFHLLSLIKHKGVWNSLPGIVVVGDYDDTKTFATKVLGGFISDSRLQDCLQIKMKDLDSSNLFWEDLVKRVLESKAVIVDLSPAGDDLQMRSILDKLIVELQKLKFANTPFVFYADFKVVEVLHRYSSIFACFMREENTFWLPLKAGSALEEEGEETEDGDSEENLMDDFLQSNLTDWQFEKALKNKSDRFSDAPMAPHRESAEETLQKMIGLESVKAEIECARNMALFNKRRRELGLDDSNENRNHMLFLGNPGTGKTTVARLIGRMYHDMGLLSRGNTVETNRSKLIGEYIGHTEQKTNEAINRARGGVLFIDEAYTLVAADDGNSRDFGKEAMNALLTLLSEPNPDLIVILAGYEDKMQALLSMNPGLKDRFPLKFYFEDYTSEQLFEIAHNLLEERKFTLTAEAANQLVEVIGKAWNNRDRYFGNGRWIHNLVEHGIMKHMAARVMKVTSVDDEKVLFSRVEMSDVMAAAMEIQKEHVLQIEPRRCIGFRA